MWRDSGIGEVSSVVRGGVFVEVVAGAVKETAF